MNPPSSFSTAAAPGTPPLAWRCCPLSRIHADSRWSIHPFLDPEPPPDQLIASVRRFGILQPPLVIATTDDDFIVLSGLRRLRALRHVGGQETLCRVLAADIDKLALLLFICEEHCWYSPLTLAEKAFLLAMARRLLPSDNFPAELYALVSLPSQIQARARETARLLALTALPPEILRAIHDGRITAATAQTMTALSAADQQAVFATLTQIPLGDNKQKRFLHLLAEAGALRQETFATMLRFPEITNIIDDRRMNGPQKAQRLLDAFTALAAPESSQAEQRFRQWQSALALPAGAHIEHSPAFENDALRLILPFAGREAVEAFWQRTREQIQQTTRQAS